MPAFAFTTTIHEREVRSADLQNRLNALETALETAKVREDQLAAQSVEYRHFNRPMVILLQRETVIPTGLPGWSGAPAPLALGALVGGYYPVVSSGLKISTALQLAANIYEASQPVYQFVGRVYTSATVGGQDGSNLISRVGVGRSTDGGATWALIAGTDRPVQANNGYVPPFYGAAAMNHYITGLANYTPFNHNFDHAALVAASFGGDLRNAVSNATTDVCVMVNQNTLGRGSVYIITELTARLAA